PGGRLGRSPCAGRRKDRLRGPALSGWQRMALAPRSRWLGRYVEPARWVLIALDAGPLGLIGLLDATRSLDGPIGPGTLLNAVSRLETLRLVDSEVTAGRGRMYRLTILGRGARGSATIVKG